MLFPINIGKFWRVKEHTYILYQKKKEYQIGSKAWIALKIVGFGPYLHK